MSHHRPSRVRIIVQQLKKKIIGILYSKCNSAAHWLSSDINLAPYLFSSCLFNNRSHNNQTVNNVQFKDDNYFPRTPTASHVCAFFPPNRLSFIRTASTDPRQISQVVSCMSKYSEAIFYQGSANMRWKRMKISACEEFLTWCYLGLQQTSRCGNNICTVIVFIQTEW